MLFLKAMLLKHKFSMIVIIFMLGFCSYQWLNHKAYIRYLNSIIEQVKINDLRRAEEDSLSQIEYANEKAELDGLIVIQKNEIVKLKDQVFEIRDAVQDTTKTGGIEVTFKKENPCMGVKGYTVTATEFEDEYAIVEFYGKPIDIKRRYITVGGKVVEIIRPENDCIEFKRTAFDIPPNLPDLLKLKQPQRSFFGPFIVGGTLGVILALFLTH